jgi:hypothetical protein
MQENHVKIKFKYLGEDGEFYQLDNIPFYALNYALDDIIEAKLIEGELFADSVVKESGNSTIHIVFFDSNIVEKSRAELKEMGCDSELSNIESLIAVNVPSNVNYNHIVKVYLDEKSEKGLLDYQEACLAQ